jgi:hypothetical protein
MYLSYPQRLPERYCSSGGTLFSIRSYDHDLGDAGQFPYQYPEAVSRYTVVIGYQNLHVESLKVYHSGKLNGKR